jgi:hypothetical protein
VAKPLKGENQGEHQRENFCVSGVHMFSLVIGFDSDLGHPFVDAVQSLPSKLNNCSAGCLAPRVPCCLFYISSGVPRAENFSQSI